MEDKSAIAALTALAQESRLPIFRLLVQEGPDGLPAGEIGQKLGVPPNALSFHLTRLRFAGLITARRNGRQIIYAVDYKAAQNLSAFLTENCCQRSATKCSSDCPQPASSQTNEQQGRQKRRPA